MGLACESCPLRVGPYGALFERTLARIVPSLQMHKHAHTSFAAAFRNSIGCTGGHYTFSHNPGDTFPIGIVKLACRFTPEPTDRNNFRCGYTTVTLTVIGRPPTLIWQDPPSIVFPTPLTDKQLRAVCCVEAVTRSKSLRGSSAVENIEGTSSHGNELNDLVVLMGQMEYEPTFGTILPAGEHVLKCRFVPTGPDSLEYRPLEGHVTLIVRPLQLQCTWPRPLFVYLGTPLAEKDVFQCQVINWPPPALPNLAPCILRYSHSDGEVLGLGDHVISCEVECPEEIIRTYGPQMSVLPATCSVIQHVHPKTVTSVTWASPADIRHPAPLTRVQLCAYVSGAFAGRMEYDPPAGTVLPAGLHRLHVSFVPSEVSRAISQQSVEITVIKGRSLLIWDTPYPIIEDDCLGSGSLNCRCVNLDSGSFYYTPPMGSILALGTHVLSCTFTPDDAINYECASLSVKLVVNPRPKMMPEIDWHQTTSLGHFKYPHKLSKRQLNARCNIPGEFRYSHKPGHVFPVGAHLITCRFQPYDTRRFEANQASAYIHIEKGATRVLWAAFSLSCGEPLNTVDHLTAVAVLHTDSASYSEVISESDSDSESDADVAKKAEVVLMVDASLLKKNLPAFALKPLPGRFDYSHIVGTLLDAGVHRITCDFTPEDTATYESSTLTVVATVKRTVPQLHWECFSYHIDAGAPIVSFVHLTARCVKPLGVPGTFVYSQNDGDVLPPGRHVISCRFYPVDIDNYYGGTASIELTVS